MYLCQLSKCSQTPPPLRPSLSHCLLSAHGRCKPKRGFCQRQRVTPVYQRKGRTKFHPFFVFINRLPRTMLFQQGYLPIKKTKHHLSCVSKDITPSPISGNKIPKGAKFHLAWQPRKPQKFFTRRSFPNDCLQFLPQQSIAVFCFQHLHRELLTRQVSFR